MKSVKDHYGKVAYEAYCETRQWKSFNGSKLPLWDNVMPDIKDGWIAAANAVLQTVEEDNLSSL